MRRNRQCGVYEIRNLMTGLRYVGSAVVIGRRWRSHRALLRAGRHHSPKLQQAWADCGESSFECRMLLCCAETDLLFYEQRALDQLCRAGTGYNRSPLAQPTRLGTPHPPEVRARLAAAFRLRGPEWRAKMAAISRGQKHSPESFAKQVATRRANGDTYRKGQRISAEHRARISASVRETFRLHPELRVKQSAAQRGHIVSTETRAKISATKRRNIALRKAALSP